MCKPRLILICTMLIQITGLLSCSKKQMVSDMVSDPEFTYQTLTSKTLLVAGVSSTIGGHEFDYEQAMQRGAFLNSALRDKAPFCRIAEQSEYQSRLGEPLAETTMRLYHDKGGLPAKNLHELQGVIGDQDVYLIVGNLYNTRGSNEYHFDNKDSTTQTARLVMETIRRVWGKFNVYDISRESLVWSGTLTDAAAESNEYVTHWNPSGKDEIDNDGGGGFLGSLFDAIFGGDNDSDSKPVYEYPDPPPFEKVANKVLVEFARYMPPKPEDD